MTLSLHSTPRPKPTTHGRVIPWGDPWVSLVNSTPGLFNGSWKRAHPRNRRRVREWLHDTLHLLQPLIDDQHFYAFTLTVPNGLSDPYAALERALVALRRCEALARCQGTIVRHGSRRVRPHLHLVLASPEPLSRTARERAREIVKGNHTGGLTEFRQLFLNHGARPQPWSTLDPAERRLALESALLYLGREILDLPEHGTGPRRRFERFSGKSTPPRPPSPREDPWLLITQITGVKLRLGW